MIEVGSIKILTVDILNSDLLKEGVTLIKIKSYLRKMKEDTTETINTRETIDIKGTTDTEIRKGRNRIPGIKRIVIKRIDTKTMSIRSRKIVREVEAEEKIPKKIEMTRKIKGIAKRIDRTEIKA